MLEIFRNKKNSVLLLGTLGIILLGFVFFGIPTGGGPKNYVAMVDGEKISINEYQKLYRRQIDFLREQMGDRFSEDLVNTADIQDRTIQILINNILILDAADKDKVAVSDSESQDIILNVEAFQRDGVFNKEQYFAVLQKNRLEVSEYESKVRDNLIMDKMREKIVGELEVTGEEAWERFAADNRSVSYDYISANSASFLGDAEPDTEEVSRYYEAYGTLFTVPTKIKVFYAKLDIEGLSGDTTPSDENLKYFYEDHKEDYFLPASVRARHILIRGGKDKEQSRKKALGLLERLRAGEKFSTLAKKFSEDPGSAKKGGDLGYFTNGTMVKPFEDAAFSMAPGEVSSLVESVYGFHIIKVEDNKESSYRPLDDVKKDLLPKLARVEAAALASGRASDLTAAFEEADNTEALKKAAQDAGFKFGEAGPFDNTAKEKDNEIASDELARNAAFGLDSGGVSAPVETQDAVYLIKVMERVEEHVPLFEDVAGEVTAAAKKDKSVRLAREAAEALLTKLTGGVAFEEEAKGENFDVGVTEPAIKRSGAIRELGLNVSDKEGFFDLTSEAPYFGEVIKGTEVDKDKKVSEIFYVFKYKDFKEVDKKIFDDNKDAHINRLTEEKKNEVMTDWIEGLRKDADIRINEELL